MLVLCHKLHICTYDWQIFFQWPVPFGGPASPPKMELLEPPLVTGRLDARMACAASYCHRIETSCCLMPHSHGRIDSRRRDGLVEPSRALWIESVTVRHGSGSRAARPTDCQPLYCMPWDRHDSDFEIFWTCSVFSSYSSIARSNELYIIVSSRRESYSHCRLELEPGGVK